MYMCGPFVDHGCHPKKEEKSFWEACFGKVRKERKRAPTTQPTPL
jgi:hypothetical protein